MKQLSQTPEAIAFVLEKPREEAMQSMARKRTARDARKAAQNSSAPGISQFVKRKGIA